MKKNIILVLLWLISIVFFVSCNQDAPAQFGSLELNINSEVSRGIQAVSMETASYNITVNDSSENVVFSSTGNAQSSYSVSVLAGTYNVYVEALNNEGDVIGAGSSAVVVKASQVNSCSITVYELTGNGTFGISITANEGYPLAYSIKMADGTEVKDGNLEYSNGRYAVSEELANGFYVFKITRTDTNKVLKTDAIRIIKDKAVSYSATFQFLTDGTIVIVNEISGTPTIDISINKATFNAGDMLKASAVISDIDEGYTCFWLIDGVAVTEAGAYEDLSYEIPESDETEHEVALVVKNGSVIWSDSYTFHVVDYKYNTELEVEGAVELWLVGDVLIPRDFKAFVSYGDKIVVLQSTQSHFVFDVGDKVILTCSLSDNDYNYHLESSYNEVTETTVCYVVIDRDIENAGYIKVNFGDIPYLDSSMSFGVWLYGENTILNPNNNNDRYKHFGLVVVTNDRNPRILKVDPDQYYQCAVHGHNYELFDISRIDRTRFTVLEGETKETTISLPAFDSLINVDLTGLTADAVFTEMAEAIYLYVGETIVGSWTSPEYFNKWPESQQRGLYAGENYEVKAVISLNEGVSEADFPFEIVPDINTLTVEEGHTYTVKFTTVEKEGINQTIRPRYYSYNPETGTSYSGDDTYSREFRRYVVDDDFQIICYPHDIYMTYILGGGTGKDSPDNAYREAFYWYLETYLDTTKEDLYGMIADDTIDTWLASISEDHPQASENDVADCSVITVRASIPSNYSDSDELILRDVFFYKDDKNFLQLSDGSAVSDENKPYIVTEDWESRQVCWMFLPYSYLETYEENHSAWDGSHHIFRDYLVYKGVLTEQEKNNYNYTFPVSLLKEVFEDHSLRVLNNTDKNGPNYGNEVAQIWNKFVAEHPEIEIIREDLYGEQFHQKVETYTAQDQLPDVMYVWPSGRSSTLHEEGLLYDLEPLLRRDGLLDKYNPLCTAPQLGGYLGELPSGVTATSMMFVNEKVLRENNLEIPETYNDLKAMVPVLNAKGIEVITMDCQDGWVMQSCLFSLIAGRFGGSDWYDRLVAGEIDFEDDWFKKALTVVDNLYKDGIINRNRLNASYGSGRAGFAAGRSAFYIDGDWACASFQTDPSTGDALLSAAQQANDVSLMNFPSLDGEIVHESNSAIVGTGWAISADIDPSKLEAAWTLVKYLEGEYVQTWRLVHGVAFPSLTTLDANDICEENNLEPLVAKRADWYNSIQVATPVIDGVLDPSVYEVINQVLAEIGSGDMTVDQAASAVNNAWHNYAGH